MQTHYTIGESSTTMRNFFLAAAIVVPAFAAPGQVNFNQVAISNPLTIADIQAAAGQGTTSQIDGVALGPGQNVFLIHTNNAAQETIVGINPFTKQVSFTKTHSSIASDLNTTWSALANFPILTGEFVYDPNTGPQGTLYLADKTAANPDGETALFRINVATGLASTVLFGTQIAGWNSHGVLPSGKIVGTLGEDYKDFTGDEPKVGIVDPANPSFVELFDEDEFKDAVVPPLAVTEECPPETIGVHPVTGQVYVFGHDTLHLFRIDNPEGTPALNWLNIAGWTGVVDLHGLAVDEDGNVYGFDEAAESIVVWNGTNTFSVDVDDIAAAVPGTFEPALWRGMKARKISATQSEVWLSDKTGGSGLVRLVFGNPAASVQDWALFE
jgi:hypothetical protein